MAVGGGWGCDVLGLYEDATGCGLAKKEDNVNCRTFCSIFFGPALGTLLTHLLFFEDDLGSRDADDNVFTAFNPFCRLHCVSIVRHSSGCSAKDNKISLADICNDLHRGMVI